MRAAEVVPSARWGLPGCTLGGHFCLLLFAPLLGSLCRTPLLLQLTLTQCVLLGLLRRQRGRFCPLGATWPSLCAAGSHAARERMSACELCAAGSHQAAVGAVDCVTCRPGSFCPTGATMELPANCPPGTYGNVSEADGVPTCFGCELGRFCAGGAAPMRNCTAGSYADKREMEVCHECAAGAVDAAAGAATSLY